MRMNYDSNSQVLTEQMSVAEDKLSASAVYLALTGSKYSTSSNLTAH